ncbi:MAG: acyl-CoA dehydrogenase [Myxococcales bacterium]|nr:acyl-CoA dehydrogenase [Myxococcales bacterium]
MPADTLPILPGGSFLLHAAGAARIFAPEGFTEEQRAMAAEAQRFMEKEVFPQERFLESKEGKASKAMIQVLRKACDLGFGLVEVPEDLGGLGADKVTSLLVAEKLSTSGDFCVTWGAHSGIGLAPILYFGNAAQKHKYLERIGSGRAVSCYALSEPGSGSDALAARTTARLNAAGTHYVLNGTKQWITNAAWMDVGVVFAKVDADKFTAFIVERGTPGFTIGNEEHKLGLRGSSTCQLIFENAAVPVENVLGEVGKGHRIAFNTLNLGRYKLGGGVVGLAKRALGEALTYAGDRKQFGTRIADFGAIREQIADSMIQIYLGETVCYGIAGAIDSRLADVDPHQPDYVERQMAAIEEYAIEASIAKVYCSEALDRILDRALQWHGGYGFVEDYNVEKFVRDARVNRIFEGTNEINRLLVPGTLFKRALQRRLALTFDSVPELADVPAGPLAPAHDALARTKALTRLVMGAAAARFGMALDGEQELMVGIANLCIDACVVDSAMARTAQRLTAADPLAAMNTEARTAGSAASTVAACTVAACTVAAAEALDRAVASARRLLAACFSGAALDPWLERAAQFSTTAPTNLIACKRLIAADAVARGGYRWSTY